MVMLMADGGQMTVGRRTGVYTYGQFQVILPEGREQASSDERLQEGYISRPPGEDHGRFDVTFVRADATVDLSTGVSDLESVIDTAQKRSTGDVFFERDITGRGLGRWRPGIDYTTGDVVDVSIWGKTLALPVTAVDMVANDRGRAGWRVHVGGQLISDAEALRTQNRDLEAQIASERRQRLREVDGVRSTADAAVRLADPQRTVVPADDTGRPHWAAGATSTDTDLPPGAEATVATTTWTGYSAATASEEPEAWVDLSDQLDWKLGVWAKPGTATTAHFRLVDQDGNDCILQWKQHRPLGDSWYPTSTVTIAPDLEEWERYEYVVRLKPGTKTVRLLLDNPGPGDSVRLNQLALTVLSWTKEDIDALQTQQIEENRDLSERLRLAVEKLDKLQRLVIGSTHSNVDYDVPTTDLPSRGTFVELFSFTAAKDIYWDILFEVGWDAANRGDTYRLSIWIDGWEYDTYFTDSIGPTFPWEDGFRRMWMTPQGVQVYEGETISFRVLSSASNTSQRRVRWAYINMTESI